MNQSDKLFEVYRNALNYALRIITDSKGICCLKHECPNFEYTNDGGGCKYQYQNNNKCLTKEDARAFLICKCEDELEEYLLKNGSKMKNNVLNFEETIESVFIEPTNKTINICEFKDKRNNNQIIVGSPGKGRMYTKEEFNKQMKKERGK